MSPSAFRKILSFLFLFLVQCATLNAADAPSHFEQANRLYEQGKYSEAASLYESMIKAGRHSSAVFFNLGNCYFKSGNLGRALLNYRVAERIAPRDPDIQGNLRFTRERVPGGNSLDEPIWKRAMLYFTLNELAVFCSALFWGWAALACATALRPDLKPKLRTYFIGVQLALAVAILALVLAWFASRGRIAIVTASQATVHLGPVAESQAAFTALNGVELKLLARRDDWLQVTDRSDRSGWVVATNVATFPPW
jgi:tetratricopeptide (TPR) repeat protein